VSNGSNNIPFPKISTEEHSSVINNIAAGDVKSTSLMMPSEALGTTVAQGNSNNNNNNNNNNSTIFECI
jgi:hypothetical protein